MSARSSGTFMTLSVVAQHRGTTYSWSEEPGIEHWTVELLLSGKMPGSQEDRSVIIAAAEIWRIDNSLCLDQVFEPTASPMTLLSWGTRSTHRER